MTAEIAIFNRGGIALAADSAITTGRTRVWKTSNKIFSLSPRNDIGVMVYGAGDFLGYPWETLIKHFRESVATAQFETVHACVEAFMQYIGGPQLDDPDMEDMSTSMLWITLLEDIKKNLHYNSKMEFRAEAQRVVQKRIASLASHKIIATNVVQRDFSSAYGDTIAGLASDILKQNVTAKIRDALVKLCYEVFVRKDCFSRFETGIVFSGFGKHELYPSVIHIYVDGKGLGVVRQWIDEAVDFNTNRDHRAIIMPFAQSDIMHLFIEGISTRHLVYLRSTFKSILDAKSDELTKQYVKKQDERVVERALQAKDNTKLVSALMDEFDKYRDQSLIQPVMDVLESLPKEEMAEMAEALVALTSLRRRVDATLESVAEPVDVAVISKGDGFIWLKRKHYFSIDTNMDFKYRKELRSGRNEDGK